MNIIWEQELVYFLRLLIAGICGMAIGFERKNRAKEAGIRTHFVVACGAALMMIISKYGFADFQSVPGLKEADGSRIAAQIVSGVGFLGAGMIFVQKKTVTGLTTAAGIWTTAGIGMAIGSGMYVLGVSATVIILIAQVLLHKNIRMLRVPKNKLLFISGVTSSEFQMYAIQMLTGKEVHIFDTTVTKYSSNKSYDYRFVIEIPANVTEGEILSMFDYDCSIRDAAE